MTALTNAQSNRLGWTLSAIAGVLLFAAFTVWGGVPTDDRAGIFWLQMGVLFLAMVAFVLLFWHLLVRPLAANLRVPKAEYLPVKLRQRIGLVQAGGLLAIVVGGMWDELWHRTYAIPFGDDFFWRPHMLMYFGFITFIGVGFWALHYLNSRLKGKLSATISRQSHRRLVRLERRLHALRLDIGSLLALDLWRRPGRLECAAFDLADKLPRVAFGGAICESVDGALGPLADNFQLQDR